MSSHICVIFSLIHGQKISVQRLTAVITQYTSQYTSQYTKDSRLFICKWAFMYNFLSVAAGFRCQFSISFAKSYHPPCVGISVGMNLKWALPYMKILILAISNLYNFSSLCFIPLKYQCSRYFSETFHMEDLPSYFNL